ncbi:CAP domain-containing protein [Yoonia vestfoldensis]|uniref:CAP domain-containing protein n=1 Tax=Yoonia vestfoldensis TaxID=245188 RepID=UPI00037B83FE|nr:CAP domain-containing protein [Yoonia vestfoldensis]
MYRRALILGLVTAGVSACVGGPNRALGPDGLPLPTAYIIAPGEEAAVKFRMLDSVNALRQAARVGPVALDPQLNAAAATHARDMSIQNRPWLFGADGSSPVQRARRAGFTGRFLGETISESYESELATLTAWMNDERTRAVIMDPNAQLMGFSWFQEPAGKLWWTLNMGTAPGFASGLS